mmetsp:Transcript_28799/g.85206  ORF Transcript_28799/g.85206 Transcript_28799/m.85206 type:complete len:287 (-) Transcript_28799:3658-4518(-)
MHSTCAMYPRSSRAWWPSVLGSVPTPRPRSRGCGCTRTCASSTTGLCATGTSASSRRWYMSCCARVSTCARTTTSSLCARASCLATSCAWACRTRSACTRRCRTASGCWRCWATTSTSTIRSTKRRCSWCSLSTRCNTSAASRAFCASRAALRCSWASAAAASKASRALQHLCRRPRASPSSSPATTATQSSETTCGSCTENVVWTDSASRFCSPTTTLWTSRLWRTSTACSTAGISPGSSQRTSVIAFLPNSARTLPITGSRRRARACGARLWSACATTCTWCWR